MRKEARTPVNRILKKIAGCNWRESPEKDNKNGFVGGGASTPRMGEIKNKRKFVAEHSVLHKN